jgi:hypothetical protein
MGSQADNSSIVTVLVSIITALSSTITTAAGGAVTTANIGTSINNQGTNDLGMTAQEKDMLSKIATAISATSPTSSIRNSNYAS